MAEEKKKCKACGAAVFAIPDAQGVIRVLDAEEPIYAMEELEDGRWRATRVAAIAFVSHQSVCSQRGREQAKRMKRGA